MDFQALSRYRFRSVWELPAPPAAVYTVLERADDYPRWWPQVRSVTSLDETSGVAVFRSFLPYQLTVTAREERRDPAAGILEIAMSGDLAGWARWTLTARGSGTRAVYDQEVEVRKALMRRFALLGRPVFVANHAWMMRGGQRGLRAHLQPV
ncbi:SRPBCC family protein [Streptomyces kunmingensis]|uniref:SRPBCC family protein n=1 Tax=Streptomyces kunmingensis TaxID=68225 RepID=A0ABU6CGE0_9ACTN|nr:SRPBCC family protein [Streptomyces kunmingensis]MEB3963772.1 SRPBCC family protein [Streptomyces kunmingensis]